MKKKVFLTRTLQDFALKELKKNYQVEIHNGKIPIPQKILRTKIKKIDGLICFPYDKIDKETIELADNLKAISTFSVGFDHIDTKFAKKKKIRIGFTPEVLNDATADLAFALMLDLLRRVSEGDRVIRNGKWKKVFGADDFVGLDLQGKTLGIIGLGRIGQILAKRAKAFDMNVIYYNRNHIGTDKEKKLKVKFTSFENLISKSDVISLHVPHTKETNQMINMKIFKKMKQSAFLINTSRGKVVNQVELVTALKKKIISGAGLDVFETEPISNKSPFTKLENVVLAPHIGSSTRETRDNMARITIENLNRGINGKKPIYSVGY